MKQTYDSRSEKDYVPLPLKKIDENLRSIRDEAKSVVQNLIDSLSGSNPCPFDRKLVKAKVDDAVSVTEKATGMLTEGFLFLTTQFMTDFAITLVNKSVDALLAQQKKDEERAKKKLREIKEDQRWRFLAFVKL